MDTDQLILPGLVESGEELVESVEFDLPEARGRPGVACFATIVRELEPDDVPKIGRGVLSSGETRIQRLRYSHHKLAELLASGMEDVLASAMTGYSPGYIYQLKHNDPMFQELLAQYSEARHKVFVDTLERMKLLGLSTLDELQARLEEAPESWSKRELLEMSKLMLIDGQKTLVNINANAGSGSASSGGLTVNVNFVTPSVSDSPVIDNISDVIDVESEEIRQ